MFIKLPFFLICFSLTAQYNFDKLKERMHQFVDENELVGIQTMIIKDDKQIFSDTYGFADIENQEKLKFNSIFRIGSITKCIAVIGIMKLFDKGYFKLDDPIGKYIPEFNDLYVYQLDGTLKPSIKNIKIIDLLRHTSGIGKIYQPLKKKFDDLKLNRSFNLETEIRRMSQIPLAVEPGTLWLYGPSISIAAYLVERLTDTNINDYLKKEIFEPLEMEDTYFEIPQHKRARFTSWYLKNKDKGYQLLEDKTESPFINKVTFFNPSGGLVSTINDLSNLCSMLLNKGFFKGKWILKQQTVELISKDHLNGIQNGRPTNTNHNPNDAIGFGLGFNVIKDIKKYPFPGSQGSYGWWGTPGTYLRIDPKQKMAMILLTNMKGWNYSRREIFESLVYKSIFGFTEN